MKQTTTLWSLLLTLLMAVTIGTAQEPATPRLQAAPAGTSLRADGTLTGFGYADRSAKPSYIGVGATNIYLSTYILLPDVGANKIEKISFPASKADKLAYLLVLSADGKKTLYNQPCEIAAGINEMTLTTPFATEAGKRYLVGFATKAVGSAKGDKFVLPFDGKSEIEDALTVAYGSDPFPTDKSTPLTFKLGSAKGSNLGSALVFVTLQDDSKLQDLGCLTAVEGNFSMIKVGTKVSTKVSLRNIGMNEITSFDLTYQFGAGEVKTISHTVTPALAATQTGEYTLEIPIEAEGTGIVHFAVSKVNGKESPYADNRRDLPYLVGDYNAIDRETVLLERFTGEDCPYCPLADAPIDAFIKQMTEAGLRVSYVAYHVMNKDFLAINEPYDIRDYFLVSGFPAISVNRSVTPNGQSLSQNGAISKDDATMWTNKMKNGKQGVKINRIDQTISDDGTLEAVIEGVALKNSFDPEDLYLTVIVTEDNIPARNQAGAKKGYKHHAVPRLYLTAAVGDKLKVDADGSFKVTLRGTLKSDWNGSECHVVAIVHPSIKQAKLAKRAVHTAETAPLGFGLANEPVAPAQAPVVTTEGGYLNILGRVDAFELYDMSGALVTTSVETRLLPGTYIIRIFSDLRVYTSKVIVR